MEEFYSHVIKPGKLQLHPVNLQLGGLEI